MLQGNPRYQKILFSWQLSRLRWISFDFWLAFLDFRKTLSLSITHITINELFTRNIYFHSSRFLLSGFFFSSQYQKFRCTWINSLFKIGWFLLEFFCCFCQNHQRQGYQVFLMVYYCQFAVKIGQIVSKNATLLKMEITLLVINFKYLEILLLVKTIDQKLVAMTFEK